MRINYTGCMKLVRLVIDHNSHSNGPKGIQSVVEQHAVRSCERVQEDIHALCF
jgi:hypothetical protein